MASTMNMLRYGRLVDITEILDTCEVDQETLICYLTQSVANLATKLMVTQHALVELSSKVNNTQQHINITGCQTGQFSVDVDKEQEYNNG